MLEMLIEVRERVLFLFLGVAKLKLTGGVNHAGDVLEVIEFRALDDEPGMAEEKGSNSNERPPRAGPPPPPTKTKKKKIK